MPALPASRATGAAHRCVRRRGGFSLIEAVVATGILMLTCVAVSGVLSAALRAQGALEGRGRLEDALIAECARLEALPYWSPAPAQGSAPGDQRHSLLGQIFPHADPSLNVAGAAYAMLPGAAETAVFVTVVDHEGVVVRRTATFLAPISGGEVPLAPAALVGWTASGAAGPPSSTVRVHMQAEAQGRTAARCLVLTWLRPSLEPSPQSVALGQAWPSAEGGAGHAQLSR